MKTPLRSLSRTPSSKTARRVRDVTSVVVDGDEAAETKEGPAALFRSALEPPPPLPLPLLLPTRPPFAADDDGANVETSVEFDGPPPVVAVGGLRPALLTALGLLWTAEDDDETIGEGRPPPPTPPTSGGGGGGPRDKREEEEVEEEEKDDEYDDEAPPRKGERPTTRTFAERLAW